MVLQAIGITFAVIATVWRVLIIRSINRTFAPLPLRLSAPADDHVIEAESEELPVHLDDDTV